MLDYFAKNGAPCPPDENPAEHIVEVIQGNTEQKIDWVDVWSRSEERERALAELEVLNKDSKANTPEDEDQSDFATSHWFQFCMVLKRLMIQIWRSPVSSRFSQRKAHANQCRITCGTRSSCTFLQPFSAASPFGKWAMAHLLCNFVYSRSSTSSSWRLVVSIRCSPSSCITGTFLKPERKRYVCMQVGTYS